MIAGCFGIAVICVIVAVNIYVRRKPPTQEEQERIEEDRFTMQP
jgi:hypothetical protein